ncbi:MAG: HigA family addiction module antitoxin [Xanthobacteraceae bacterium]
MKTNVTAHPGRLLKRELTARELSANRLAIDIGVPSGRITDILNGRRSITADTSVRLGRYFGNSAQFWLDLQSQHDIAVVERDRGAEIVQRVRHGNARDYSVGLDARSRDRDGEIHHKRGDTLVGTLRETYGSDFAKGYRSDATLGAVLRKEKAENLSSLIKRGAKAGRR